MSQSTYAPRSLPTHLPLNACNQGEIRYPHDGTHSHPWASTPASAIASGLMGVRPLTPGWKSWLIKPAPGNLTSASIVVPTPRGAIQAKFSRSASSSSLSLNIPHKTSARLCMPLFGESASKAALFVNGEKARAQIEEKGYLCVDLPPSDDSSVFVRVMYQ